MFIKTKNGKIETKTEFTNNRTPVKVEFKLVSGLRTILKIRNVQSTVINKFLPILKFLFFIKKKINSEIVVRIKQKSNIICIPLKIKIIG
jgi:hypothetical protein